MSNAPVVLWTDPSATTPTRGHVSESSKSRSAIEMSAACTYVTCRHGSTAKNCMISTVGCDPSLSSEDVLLKVMYANLTARTAQRLRTSRPTNHSMEPAVKASQTKVLDINSSKSTVNNRNVTTLLCRSTIPEHSSIWRMRKSRPHQLVHPSSYR